MSEKGIKRIATSIERIKDEIMQLNEKYKKCNNTHNEIISILTEIERKENDIAELTNTIELNKQIKK